MKEAHAPIVPHSVFERAAEEKFLRGLEGRSGSSRFGSRKALIGRVWCPACEIRMERNRRQTAGFRCPACGLEISEAALKAQVMEAYFRLSEKRAEIEEKIAALDAAKRAVEIEPDNEDYRRLLEQLQNGGDFYNNYRVNYSSGLRTDRLCLTLCAANLCLGPVCRTGVICC